MTLTGRTAIAVLAGLALSLAVNFGLAGFIAARAFPDRGRQVRAEQLVSIGARSLPPALREDVARQLEPRAAALRDAFRDVRDSRRAVFVAMRAVPYDRAAVAAALAVLHAKQAAVAAIGEDALLSALDAASPDQRATINIPPQRRPDSGDR